jgi:hypothetical protein
MNDELYAVPPSIEYIDHWESCAGGVFPKKAMEVPAYTSEL